MFAASAPRCLLAALRVKIGTDVVPAPQPHGIVAFKAINIRSDHIGHFWGAFSRRFLFYFEVSLLHTSCLFTATVNGLHPDWLHLHPGKCDSVCVRWLVHVSVWSSDVFTPQF